MKSVRTESEAETEAWAEALARSVVARLADESPGEAGLLIGLIGELGAGKTAFVRGFVGGVHADARRGVSSPTYAVVQEYPTQPPVRHVDLYRLSSLEDLEAIGYRDLFFGPGVTLVEWIDAIPEAIPEAWLEIRLAVLAQDVREMHVTAHGDMAAQILEET